jgi:hypothetical protein
MVKRSIEEKPAKAKDHYHNTAAAQMEEEGHQSLVALCCRIAPSSRSEAERV